MDIWRGARLELVLENDKSEELKIGLGYLAAGQQLKARKLSSSSPSHALSLEPSETLYRLSSDSDDPESVSGIVRQHVVVVIRDWRELRRCCTERAAYTKQDHICQA